MSSITEYCATFLMTTVGETKTGRVNVYLMQRLILVVEDFTTGCKSKLHFTVSIYFNFSVSSKFEFRMEEKNIGFGKSF